MLLSDCQNSKLFVIRFSRRKFDWP